MNLFETDRLLFRNHELQDMDAFCALEADPDFRRFVGRKPRSRAEAEEKFRRVYLRPVENRMGMWATIFKPDQKYIGYCGVYGEGTLGYYIAPSHWNRGLGTEAATAFVRFAFDELDLPRIVSAVEVGNDASVRILKRLGFELVRREHGDPRSFDHFELKRESWNE